MATEIIPITTPVVTPTPFQTLVQDAINQWASGTNTNPVLLTGDPLLAIFEAIAAQGVFLEGLVNTVANYGRAQTSTGTNLDTWMAQFGFTRIAAGAAQGTVTLGTTGVLSYAVVIPVGTIVQSQGGAVQYQLIADITQVAYNASQNAYIIQIGQTSITATAQSTTPGSVGNVSANQLVQIGSSIPGLATVNNAAAISNGTDAEGDTAFYARWLGYLSSLSSATLTAIEGAINSAGTNLDYQVLDNETQTGSTEYGFFTVAIEQNYLPPPASLITAVSNAVNNTRAFTVQDTVIAPTIITISTIALTVHLTVSGTNAQIQAALANFINTLPIGSTVHTSDLINTALANGAASVEGGSVLINSSESDLAITNVQVARVTIGNITISNY